MSYRELQIAHYLLLVALLARPACAAQQPAGEPPAPFTDSATAPAASPVEPELTTELPTASGKYFSTQWRSWSEGGTEDELPAHMRPTPTIDTCFDCPDDCPWFFEGGLVALQRDRWEGGTFITRAGVEMFNREDLRSRMEWGGRFSAGTRFWDCSELEITGFTLGTMNKASRGTGPFNVNLPVFNAPFGFDDFANNASLISVEYATDLDGLEVLYRRWNLLGCYDSCCGTSCSGNTCPISAGLELGIRYLSISEDFSVYSQFGPLPAPTGFQDYRYDAGADNHILGPQIGIQVRSCPWLCFDILFYSRLSVAANFINTDVSLRERTGQVAFDSTREEISCAQVLDTSIYLRMRPGHNIDVRVGYQLLWINGYAGASDQFNSNLGRAGQFDDNNGILFQGPSMLLQFNF
jgi:hypothetical protein